ncbi:MAG TPA: TolC family protein [Bryobacteraceae bacterium]|nr:TolC family protein [Bryobacteraceae bacterium]
MKKIVVVGMFVFGSLAAPLFAQAGAPIHLTLQEAEALALKNHPRVLAQQNVAGAFNQRITETRSAYYPTVDGDITGSAGNIGARIGAGYLTDSRIINHIGLGFTVNQLITDFGRTANLVAQSRLQANATEQDLRATQYDVLMAVNRVYYAILRAQALIKVAQQTLSARQLVLKQITALAQNKLRSDLDVSFAGVNVADAQLLLISSQNELQASYAEMARALGQDQPATYDLVEMPLPPSPPENVEQLVIEAIQNRPELASLRLNLQAAQRFEQAERDLSRPNVNLLGVTGYQPYIDQITLPRVIPNEYAGGAVNIQIPVFNGHLFTARQEEARYKSLEAEQRLRDSMQQIEREVRIAWATSMTAYQQLDVTATLLRQATLAMNLAQGRYDNGLSTVVDLTLAQTNLTNAEIQNLSAKYNYQAEYAGLQYTIGALR